MLGTADRGEAVAVPRSAGGHIKAERTVGGGFPSILVRTRSGAGSRLGGGLTIVRSIQLGQSHSGRAGATGTSPGECACCRDRGIFACLIGIGMSQSSHSVLCSQNSITHRAM